MIIYTGNAARDGAGHRGWFVGPFVGVPGDAGHSEAVEVKWATHRAGEHRAEWSISDSASIAVLVRGRFRMLFEERETELQAEGDFVFWGPGVPHSWACEEESVVLTLRWSEPGLPAPGKV